MLARISDFTALHEAVKNVPATSCVVCACSAQIFNDQSSVYLALKKLLLFFKEFLFVKVDIK